MLEMPVDLCGYDVQADYHLGLLYTLIVLRGTLCSWNLA